MRDRGATAEVLRFLALGGANTVVTYLLLLGLTYFVDPRVAYTVAFLVGIGANVLLTGRLVFGSRPTPRRCTLYAGWLGVAYLVGLAALQVALAVGLRAEPVLAALPLLVTAPLNFLGGRVLLADAVPSPAETQESLTR